ncbi:MAG: recombinase family protein [Oscillospiraceae bacterium]
MSTAKLTSSDISSTSTSKEPLKDLAEELTARKVPYTEKTEVWDKARIARIIDNAKYTGSKSMIPSSMKIRLRKQRRQKQPDCATKL